MAVFNMFLTFFGAVFFVMTHIYGQTKYILQKNCPHISFPCCREAPNILHPLLKRPHRLLNWQIQVTRVSWVGQSTRVMGAGCVMGHHQENEFFCTYSKSILDVWADNACNWCFCWRTEVWGKEKMWKSQTQRCTSLNPRGSVSRTTPPRTGVLCTERNSCSLLGRAGHQVAFATASRVVGWKVNFCSLL